MNYSIRAQGNIILIELTGSTWGTLGELQLKSEVTMAVAMGRRKFLVDISKVDFVTSMGLGVLVASWATIKNADGALAIYGASRRVQSLFEVAGIERVIPLMPSRDEALAVLA